MRLLFVCSRNRRRSPTAEQTFHGIAGIETASAGTSPDAEEPLSADLIAWADMILVMESRHRKRMNQTFGSLLREKTVVNLAIPDDYEYMDPALIDQLWQRVPLSVPQLIGQAPG